MPHTNQTISNPISGETITFVRTARQTEGELVEFAFSVTPGGARPPRLPRRHSGAASEGGQRQPGGARARRQGAA
jgi:hypothetical protein